MTTHTLLGITAAQRQALFDLANVLDNIERSAFDMRYFAADKKRLHILPKEYECATVACAAGHLPAAGYKPQPNENWIELIYRVTGIFTYSFAGRWMFDGDWFDIDNTPRGAARRIRYALQNGVPANACEQMVGDAPYIFAKEI